MYTSDNGRIFVKDEGALLRLSTQVETHFLPDCTWLTPPAAPTGQLASAKRRLMMPKMSDPGVSMDWMRPETGDQDQRPPDIGCIIYIYMAN
uniref:HDC16032 n=1 Tax=Drosophila melanogaster TaxID=7227 RepID=Q6IJ37_DROME|nr:TPA_inf: HDC16032 [Drosophila melanogaster]